MVMLQDKQKRLFSAPSRSCPKHHRVGGDEALPRQYSCIQIQNGIRGVIYLWSASLPFFKPKRFQIQNFMNHEFFFSSRFELLLLPSIEPTGQRSTADGKELQRASTPTDAGKLCSAIFIYMQIPVGPRLGGRRTTAISDVHLRAANAYHVSWALSRARNAVLLFYFPIYRCAFDVCLTIEWFRSIRRR